MYDDRVDSRTARDRNSRFLKDEAFTRRLRVILPLLMKEERGEMEKFLTPERVQRTLDRFYLKVALIEAEKCRGIQFYGVGCVIVSPNGSSEGHTGAMTHEHLGQTKMRHAEEVAILRAEAKGISLVGGTLYSTLEPCSERLSGLLSCTSRIIDSGIKRVVFGAHEPYDPQLKIECKGAMILAEAGIEVVHLPELQDECLASIVSKRVKR